MHYRERFFTADESCEGWFNFSNLTNEKFPASTGALREFTVVMKDTVLYLFVDLCHILWLDDICKSHSDLQCDKQWKW